MAGMIADLTPNTDEDGQAAAGAGFSTATDLADWLVRTLNMPFRDAHHVTGSAVKTAESLGDRSGGSVPGAVPGDRAEASPPRSMPSSPRPPRRPAASAMAGPLPPRSAPRSRVGRNCSDDPAPSRLKAGRLITPAGPFQRGPWRAPLAASKARTGTSRPDVGRGQEEAAWDRSAPRRFRPRPTSRPAPAAPRKSCDPASSNRTVRAAPLAGTAPRTRSAAPRRQGLPPARPRIRAV